MKVSSLIPQKDFYKYYEHKACKQILLTEKEGRLSLPYHVKQLPLPDQWYQGLLLTQRAQRVPNRTASILNLNKLNRIRVCGKTRPSLWFQDFHRRTQCLKNQEPAQYDAVREHQRTQRDHWSKHPRWKIHDPGYCFLSGRNPRIEQAGAGVGNAQFLFPSFATNQIKMCTQTHC